MVIEQTITFDATVEGLTCEDCGTDALAVTPEGEPLCADHLVAYIENRIQPGGGGA